MQVAAYVAAPETRWTTHVGTDVNLGVLTSRQRRPQRNQVRGEDFRSRLCHLTDVVDPPKLARSGSEDGKFVFLRNPTTFHPIACSSKVLSRQSGFIIA